MVITSCFVCNGSRRELTGRATRGTVPLPGEESETKSNLYSGTCKSTQTELENVSQMFTWKANTSFLYIYYLLSRFELCI